MRNLGLANSSRASLESLGMVDLAAFFLEVQANRGYALERIISMSAGFLRSSAYCGISTGLQAATAGTHMDGKRVYQDLMLSLAGEVS